MFYLLQVTSEQNHLHSLVKVEPLLGFRRDSTLAVCIQEADGRCQEKNSRLATNAYTKADAKQVKALRGMATAWPEAMVRQAATKSVSIEYLRDLEDQQ